jgi:DNA-binding transcriptional ArsR family regulator
MNIISEPNEKIQPYDLQAEIFKVLTHPARLAILDILRDGEHCVCHMEAWLGLRQAYLSQQLSVLRQAGLIRDRRDGWNIYYQIADKRIYEVLDMVRSMTGMEKAELKKPVTACVCPKCSSAASITAGEFITLPINKIR